MPRIITNLAGTTELEAINTMLSVVGEAPVLQAEIETPTLPDVQMAVNIITNVTREVLSMAWRFNTEHAYQVAPADTLVWTGEDSTTETLNMFKAPATLLALEISKTSSQQGSRLVDTEFRPSTKNGVTEDASAGTGVAIDELVFWDRAKNRPGFLATEHPFLYIDPTWFVDFEDSPEVFRRYVTIKAARRFQGHTVGSRELDGFTQQDEFLAFRSLTRDQGQVDDFNIFNNIGVLKHVGLRGRRFGAAGVLENRDSTGTQ